MNIFLTGATGFIGRNLAPRLAGEGHRVVCLVRDPSRAAWMSEFPSLEPVLGDIMDDGLLRSCVAGTDLVIHLAACTSAVSTETYFEINGRATGRLASLLAESGPGDARMIFLSSLSVAGPHTSASPAVEEEPPRPVSTYGESKLLGENLLQRNCGGRSWTVLRAPVVYGPYDRDVLFLFRLARRGILLRIRGVETETSLVHVDDLVEAVLLAAGSAEAGGKVYYVSDGRTYSRDGIHAAFREVTGRGTVVALPRAIMKGMGFLNDQAARISGKPALLNSDRVKESIQPGWVCRSDRIREDLGYTPGIFMEEGFRTTYDWYRDQGWI